MSGKLTRAAVVGFVLAVGAHAALAGSPASAVVSAYADAQKLPPDDVKRARYAGLWTLPPAERAKFVLLMKYVFNSVNTSPDGFAPLTPVGNDLVRIDLRDFGKAFGDVWDGEAAAAADPIFHIVVEEKEAEAAAYTPPPAAPKKEPMKHLERRLVTTKLVSPWIDQNGYYHDSVTREEDVWVEDAPAVAPAQDAYQQPAYTPPPAAKKKVKKGVAAPWLPTKEIVALESLTGSRSPVLSAEWLVARMSRQLDLNNKESGVGYYDFLGIKTRDDLFKICRFSEADSVAVGRDIKAAVEAADSQVAQNGRQIVQRQGPTGGVWITLDSDHPNLDGNPIHELKDGEFKAAAQEIYIPLPNGLAAKIAAKADDKGTLQASAPDFIGGNPAPGYGGRDLRIHAGAAYSCDDCHGALILRPIDDWVRRTFDNPASQLRTPDFNTNLQFRRQFFSNLQKQLEKDRAAYAEAIKDCCGLTPDETVQAVDDQGRRYFTTPLSAEDYAVWLGVSKGVLLARLKASQDATGGLDPVFIPLLRGGSISRVSAEELYSNAQFILKGIVVP